MTTKAIDDKPTNSARKVASLKPLKPVVRNNYLSNHNKNYRYGKSIVPSKALARVNKKITSSLPNIGISSLDKPKFGQLQSSTIAQNVRKPFLNVKGTKKVIDRPASPSGNSITSERTTTSLPLGAKTSDNESVSNKNNPLSFKAAIQKIKKSEINPKDKMRLDRFKKENFLYSAANKKLSLAEKYKPIISPIRNTPSGFLSKIEPPAPVTSTTPSNIASMEERKEGSNIPIMSHTERMRNNMQRLNLLNVNNTPVQSKTPLKGILKKKTVNTNTVSAITDSNMKANTLANSMMASNLLQSDPSKYY